MVRGHDFGAPWRFHFREADSDMPYSGSRNIVMEAWIKAGQSRESITIWLG
jgi:hypothetical protein